MTRPVISGRLVRWSIFFNQYEITYTPQKAVKGQALADFLADHPLPAEWELSDEFPDEYVLFIEELPPWTMFFDGSTRRNGETCSNNAAKYQALIIGLEMALDMKILQLEIYDDSKLIINQFWGIYDVKKEDLLPYHQYASCLLERFNQVFLNHVPREENHMADASVNLATIMALGENESTKKVVAKNKRDWHGKIGESLWVYRRTFRTATQVTPYSLVYGIKAVLPLEQQIPSLRIAIQEGLTSEENAQLRLAELKALDEKRLEAQQKLECYQARLARAFNKKVRPRSFQVGV
ncbi:uncharacterized protein [Nicotiana tomentosiformis]|uniref:uncharacterized protein n=1 Tax=Nicotiana tomentosiformis TaxID=4098 RepID=UPI00388C886F